MYVIYNIKEINYSFLSSQQLYLQPIIELFVEKYFHDELWPLEKNKLKSQHECGICLGGLRNGYSTCGHHYYHKKCIEKYLRTKSDTSQQFCPCRCPTEIGDLVQNVHYFIQACEMNPYVYRAFLDRCLQLQLLDMGLSVQNDETQSDTTTHVSGE